MRGNFIDIKIFSEGIEIKKHISDIGFTYRNLLY